MLTIYPLLKHTHGKNELIVIYDYSFSSGETGD